MNSIVLKSSALLATAAAVALLAGTANAQQLLPNATFTEGDEAPDGWTLHGRGQWLDRNILEVSGDGRESSAWHCTVDLQPGGLYRFECVARRVGGNGEGCMISGPGFANCDHKPTDAWQTFRHVFRVPCNESQTSVRIGHWQASGAIQFQSASLRPVLPVHVQVGSMVLGNGESIRDGLYRFHPRFAQEGNYHRTLHRATAGFNTSRWSLGRNEEVVYRFAIAECSLQSGEARLSVCHHQTGRVLLEASRDGTQWHLLAEQNELGAAEAVLPEALFPAEQVFVRLRTPNDPTSVQVDAFEFTARIDGLASQAFGQTFCAEVVVPSAQLVVERMTSESSDGTGPATVHVVARAVSPGTRTATLHATLELADGGQTSLPPVAAEIDADHLAEFRVALPPLPAGANRLQLRLTAGDLEPVALAAILDVPDFYRTDYGALLDDSDPAGTVWWCRADHKIPRQRALPAQRAEAAVLSAAGNDYEAVQLVVKAGEQPLVGLTASAGPLTGPGGAVIDARHVELLQVHYHFVATPTDYTGVRDWWPDALPPFDAPIDVPAAQNQPVWVLIYVPEDAAAGEYTGVVKLRAEGFSAAVPLRLRVWDFALPRSNNLETAYGLDLGPIVRYHRLTSEADKRYVWEKYLALMARSRLSPYDPVPLDPIRVSFQPDADPPRAELDFEAFDREFARVIEKYHFTGYRLPVRGMGGGTFHARSEPSIGAYGAGSPQFEATFADYVGQIESHLRGKGWLDMVYVYWFDEPDPKDYEFVADGMGRLKRYAPGLPRMLTEHHRPGDFRDVLAGLVDIWCPVSSAFHAEDAAKNRERGERYWWYVCTGPKAPYCTLFIDHAATELRVWHWQAWQRDIVGKLVWQSNYWTSDAAYPDSPQNPYEDPMGWVSGYSTPKGEKRPWGNGDGRFIYPPLAAATPEIAGEGPVLDPPVSSIRLEMLREGVEDYEMLHLLRTLLGSRGGALPAEARARYEALLHVPPEITADMTTFTTDPEPIHARRAEIARAIERLLRGGDGR